MRAPLLATILSLCLLQSSLLVIAQSITPDVVASSGGHFTTGGAQLSWTLGEPLTDTYTTSGNFLTQGFHQADLLITALEEENPLLATMVVYPNPTADQLTLHVEANTEVLLAELFDMNGKLLTRERIGKGDQTRQFDLSILPASGYVLRVAAEADGRAKSFSIIRAAQ